jgi:hypothetical protein
MNPTELIKIMVKLGYTEAQAIEAAQRNLECGRMYLDGQGMVQMTPIKKTA